MNATTVVNLALGALLGIALWHGILWRKDNVNLQPEPKKPSMEAMAVQECLNLRDVLTPEHVRHCKTYWHRYTELVHMNDGWKGYK